MLSIFRGDIINILVLLVAIANMTMGVLVYGQKKRDITSNIFFIFILTISMWGLSMFLYRGSVEQEKAVLFARTLYLVAAAIPFSFIYFVHTFGDKNYRIGWKLKYVLPIPFLLIAYISTFGGLIHGVTLSYPAETIINFDQKLHFAYAMYIVLYFNIVYYILFKKIQKSTDGFRLQIIYILVGTFISTIIGVISNLVMPLFGNFSLNWLGQVGILAMVVSISYSILEHHLFDVKIIFTEVVSLILTFVLLAQLLLAVTFTEAIVKAITLFFVGILLYLLVKSVFKEVKQREKMEQIAEELRIANEHLRVLDKQKSEFVSIASHQLRAPLTAITGYSSMILEGTYGPVSDKITEVLQKVFDSSRRLAVIIDDFLTISHIEQGKMTYKFETVEMKKMVQNLVEEFVPRVQGKKLYIHFTTDGYDTYNVTADAGKIQQILSNILDNAVKYSLTGGIEVRISKDFGLRKTRIMIKDTGIGLSRESIATLFQKFSRAKEVQKVYTDGSGIGLYIGQELIKAHHGRIWVESEGEGKGSSFFVELLSED